MASWTGSHSVSKSSFFTEGRCTSTLMSMLAVMKALHLGSTTMVLMSSIRMAGPGISCPGLKFFSR